MTQAPFLLSQIWHKMASMEASYVLRVKATGEAILETFRPLAKLPTPKAHLEWVGIGRHLADINKPGTPAYAWARRQPTA